MCQDGCYIGVVVVVVVGVPLTENYKLEEDQEWLEGERHLHPVWVKDV